MASTASPTDDAGSKAASRLGFTSGQVVQEFGWSDDVDDDLRAAIEATTGTELVDEDYDDVTDGVVLWWRDGDGDLTDTLVDVQTVLEDGGVIWVFTLKAGRAGPRGAQRDRGGRDHRRPARHEHLPDRGRLVRDPAGHPRPRSVTPQPRRPAAALADRPRSRGR